MKNLTKVLAAAMLLVGINSHADDIYIGDPVYGGNGCPAGSASATLSPDAKSLSILFDSYMAEAGGNTGRTLDRKACNVAIPIHVPQGFSVSIYAIDYRGYNFLPAGASSEFNVEYFLAGSKGPKFTQTFRGALDDDYLIRNTLQATALIWSKCGEDVILRSNSSMLTRTNARRDQTLSTVDSIDLQAGLVYLFQWKQCSR